MWSPMQLTVLFQSHDKIFLQTYTQLHELVTTQSNGLLSVEPRAIPLSHHSTLTAHKTMDIPSGLPFNILIKNYSDVGAS